ncbi:serine hydrolase domain-containing protein [Dictyobacter aurantiacus]|uniref:FmtA-like protein n=1 Tax=Dictyobacter aurantiacus TaxID=1936993 RepID=A0A401Z7H8_9CHLR|nr:serine hydrolase domain-containing protein [Dictyobacter aurantiacus]GCE02766.1 FmtA-like protein [Dictyobacter aurantiacus]
MVAWPYRMRYASKAFLILLVFILLTCNASRALAHALPVMAPFPPSAGPGDSRELETFLDRELGAQLAKKHIPGATVSVVKDGRLFFAKGYGYADLQHGTRVNAETTLFRIGSVSKLFTWTAVMQLAEQGKLDLHADVNRYLKTFQIPATYPQPITLAHLLTHTPGFEDRGTGIMARTPGDLEPPGTWLATHIPARVRPPGTLVSYSNYGVALAGYIVQQVSGMPFDQYVEEKIFRPLKMTYSTFRQPVPARLAPNLSKGYQYENGSNRVLPFELFQIAPAGSMSSTATDIANFMLAHLQDGRFNTQRILQEATAREMHRQHFTSDTRLPGMDYGFYEMQVNRLHLIGHGGDTTAFHSLLALLPAQQLGLFVSYNSSSGEGAREELLQAFLDHYFPVPKVQQHTPQISGFSGRANQIIGTYWPTRRSYTTFEKVFLLKDPVTVSNGSNSDLTITGVSKTPLNMREVSPWVFQEKGKTMVVVFQTHSEGTTMFVSNSLSPFMKVAWYNTPTFQYPLLLVCALIFLSALLLWLFQMVRVRHRGQTHPPLAGFCLARWLTGIVCLLNLIILAVLIVQILAEQVKEIMFGVPPWLVVLFILALASALLTIGVLVCTVLLWWKRWWSPAVRIHYTLVALAALIFAAELAYWNLLGFRA